MRNKTFVSSVFKATALSLIVSLCAILIFAVIVKFAAPSERLIKTVNQFIKVIAVFIGCFFSVRGGSGIFKGAIAGALCTFLLYAIFALMSGSALFGLSMIADVALTAAVGGISGIIAVNTKGRE